MSRLGQVSIHIGRGPTEDGSSEGKWPAYARGPDMGREDLCPHRSIDPEEAGDDEECDDHRRQKATEGVVDKAVKIKR